MCNALQIFKIWVNSQKFFDRVLAPPPHLEGWHENFFSFFSQEYLRTFGNVLNLLFYGVAVASTFVMTTSPLLRRLQSPSLLIRSRSVWSASLPTKPSPLLVKCGRFDSQLYCHWSQKHPHRDPPFFRNSKIFACWVLHLHFLWSSAKQRSRQPPPLLSRTPRQRALQRRQREVVSALQRNSCALSWRRRR